MSSQESDQNAPNGHIANNCDPLSCLNCGKRFSRADATKRHLESGSCKTVDHTLRRDDNHRPFPCPNCKKRFSRAEVVKRHLNNHTCKTFDRTLSRSKRDDEKRRKRLKVIIELNGRKLHLRRELGQKWKCPNSCGGEFPRDDVLRLHLASGCAGVDPSGHASETSSINTKTSQCHTNASPQPIPSPNIAPITTHIRPATSTQNTKPDLEAQKIFHQWDSQQQRSTWGLRPEILLKWFSKPYPSLADSSSSEVDAITPSFTREPDGKYVITDLEAAGKGTSHKQMGTIFGSYTSLSGLFWNGMKAREN